MNDTPEYLVQVSIRNNYLIERMRKAGFKSQTALAKAAGIAFTEVNNLACLRSTGQHKTGWRKSILKIADALNCMPEDLVPPQHINEALKKNSAEIPVFASDIHSFITQTKQPDVHLRAADVQRLIAETLATLSPRQEHIIRAHYGIGTEPQTLLEISKEMDYTKSRIQQIEAKALKRLRRPERKDRLRGLLEDHEVWE